MSNLSFKYQDASFPVLSFLYGFCCDTQEHQHIRDNFDAALDAYHLALPVKQFINSISDNGDGLPNADNAAAMMVYLKSELTNGSMPKYRYPDARAAVLSFLYGYFGDATEAYRIGHDPDEAFAQYQLPPDAEKVIRALWFQGAAGAAPPQAGIDALWTYLKGELQIQDHPVGVYWNQDAPVFSFLYGLYCDVREARAIRLDEESAYTAYHLDEGQKQVLRRVNLKGGQTLDGAQIEQLALDLQSELLTTGRNAW